MTKAGGNSETFTNNSIEVGNIESGSITEQVNSMIMNLSPTEKSVAEIEDVENKYGHVEEIDKWVSSLERILADIPLYMCNRGHPGRVSRVPDNLREIDVNGYEPYIMSIGPYHHDKTRVRQMEMRKKSALKCVLDYKPELTLKNLLKEIVSTEHTARSFYSDVEMERENFVHMLLLDSVYIVTTFCRLEKSKEKINEISARVGNIVDYEREINEEKGTGNDNEYLKVVVAPNETNDGMNIGDGWYWLLFAHDLFLVENQIPFFILEKIHNLVYGGSGTLFLDIMKYEIASMLTFYTKQDSKVLMLRSEEVHHLLHLCHYFFRPTIQQESTASNLPESNQMFRLGSAVQLYEAGVHFEARSCSTNYSLLDITFGSSGKLVMPCLLVDDNTESLLRNLIALEQMKYPSLGLDISSYIVLLLHLITIPKDVELLRRKGFIQHHLASDKEMMYLVNRLSMGLTFDYVEDKYSLKQVFHELKHYSERRVPRWRAWLKHRHLSNPWTAISLLVASLLLLLTIVQTYYAVYSYYYPHFNGYS